MVIADRAAIVVDTVFADPYTYRGLYIVFATFLFTIQLYCDFYGYSLMARGSALFFGISLMSNFEAPFFSKSINEFWRRWHISLSSWFKDYLGMAPHGILFFGDFCMQFTSSLEIATD